MVIILFKTAAKEAEAAKKVPVTVHGLGIGYTYN